MDNYYFQRTARAILTVWFVITLTFGMIRLLPGGPLVQLRAKLIRQGVSPSQINAIIETYMNVRPDQPIYIQYYNYIVGILTFDLGKSLVYPQSVASIIAEALPWTIFIMMTATFLIFAIAIVWGAIMAYKEGSTFDMVSSGVMTLLSSMPFYVLAIGLVVVFGYKFHVLPVRYRTSPSIEPSLTLRFVIDALRHAILPIASLVISGAGLQALSMRGNSIQILGKDYVRSGRLRGLSDGRLSVRYVARNAILPMYTGFLTLIGFYLGGSVILEQVFTYPGIGYYMFQALQNRDYPLMMGIFLVITIALVLSVFIADLTYGKVDPRVKSGDANESY